MDSIRRNRQIDSLKYLILKCEDESSIISDPSLDSLNQSLLINTLDSNTLKTVDSNLTTPYKGELLGQLNTLAMVNSRLHESTLLADSCLLHEGDGSQSLPAASVLTDLVRELDQLGSQLAWAGQHLETVSWRLLQIKFTSGLNIPYEQHQAVQSLLCRMADLMSQLADVGSTLQKAAAYKPSHKMGAFVTKSMQSVVELQGRLESIKNMRLCFTTGVLAPQLGSSSSLDSGPDTSLQHLQNYSSAG